MCTHMPTMVYCHRNVIVDIHVDRCVLLSLIHRHAFTMVWCHYCLYAVNDVSYVIISEEDLLAGCSRHDFCDGWDMLSV